VKERRVDTDNALYPPRALTIHAQLSQNRASWHKGRAAGGSGEKKKLTPRKIGAKWDDKKTAMQKAGKKTNSILF
jgi:hypothetical protein